MHETDGAAGPGVPGPAVPGPGALGPALTIGAAAHRLGVAVPTLRSWERRYGLAPSAHSPGGHRRYSPGDMARLGRFCRLVGQGVGTAEAAASALAEPGGTAGAQAAEPRGSGVRAGGGRTLPVGRAGSAEARGLARCAVRMDSPQIIELLRAAIARHGVAEAWERVIEPALRAVGRKWTESGGRYVEVEHLLSWCVTVALHSLTAAASSSGVSTSGVSAPGVSAPVPAPTPTPTSTPVAAGRVVLLACAPDEWHSLPLEVLRTALAERGTPVCMLGPAVPADALRSAVGRLDPAAVIVWSQSAATANPARLPRPADPARCRVHPAGPGWAAVAGPALRGAVLTTLTGALDAGTAA
jgi:DNA-binding transcriptional MerR regulator